MVGNGLKETVTEGGKSEETVYGYNGLNQLLTSVTTSDGSRISEQSYSYDENGNERKVTDSISGTVAENTYDIDNRLKAAVRKENNAIRLTQENQYDGNGQRIRKTENGSTTLYQYQNQSVLGTTDENGNQTSFQLLGAADQTIATMRYTGDYAGKAYFYQKDIKGSTMSLGDEEGEGILAYEYDDFGETTKQGDEDFFNEICYTGAIYDESTGLYYLNARYYNPEDGRFLTQDTYRGEDNEPGTWHLYAYCANNPVNYVDPTGHWVHTFGVETSVSCIFSASYSHQIGIDSKGYVNFSVSTSIGVKISKPSAGVAWVYSSYPNLSSVSGLGGKTFTVGGSIDIFLFSISGTVYVDTSAGKAGICGSASKGVGVKVPSGGGSTSAYRVKTYCSKKAKISSLFKMKIGKKKNFKAKGKKVTVKREKTCISFSGKKIKGTITKSKDFALKKK